MVIFRYQIIFLVVPATVIIKQENLKRRIEFQLKVSPGKVYKHQQHIQKMGL